MSHEEKNLSHEGTRRHTKKRSFMTFLSSFCFLRVGAKRHSCAFVADLHLEFGASQRFVQMMEAVQ